MISLAFVVCLAVLGLPTRAGAGSKKTAGQILLALKKAGIPVEKSIVYNERTDPNNLLGRPGGYTSKATFTLKWVPVDDRTEGFEVSNGGGLEVYKDRAGALKRAKYIKDTNDSFAILSKEYLYVEGSALLRVAYAVTPTDAKRIEKSFRAIV